MPVRHDDPRPPYLQLADELRQAITTGEFEPGDRLPSRRKLAFDNGIAEMTVQHAIDVLAEQGLVVAQQGRGVFVQEPKTPTAAAGHGAEAEPKTTKDLLDQALADLKAANEALDAAQDRLHRYEAIYPEPPEPAIDHGPEPGGPGFGP